MIRIEWHQKIRRDARKKERFEKRLRQKIKRAKKEDDSREDTVLSQEKENRYEKKDYVPGFKSIKGCDRSWMYYYKKAKEDRDVQKEVVGYPMIPLSNFQTLDGKFMRCLAYLERVCQDVDEIKKKQDHLEEKIVLLIERLNYLEDRYAEILEVRIK